MITVGLGGAPPSLANKAYKPARSLKSSELL
eukprot:COSAG02_NODE_67_length_42609_cov_14.506681_6_plen_31_part_00